MITEILEYLYQFKDGQYHLINPFLQEKFGDRDLNDIRTVLLGLLDAERIESNRTNIKKFGQYTQIAEISIYINSLANLETWPMTARLSNKEREKMDKESKIKPQVVTNNTINIGGNNTGTVVQSSDFTDSIFTPSNTPNINDIKTGQKKGLLMKFWTLISENKLISGVISAVIVAFIVYILKLK